MGMMSPTESVNKAKCHKGWGAVTKMKSPAWVVFHECSQPSEARKVRKGGTPE
jgi:hypothetical protein